MVRLVLNGKRAADERMREAVEKIRQEGIAVEVRVTWERGDAGMFVQEAAKAGLERVIVAGGDGSINEAINGLMALPKSERPVLGIVPFGTANDFATAAKMPQTPYEALHLAIHGTPANVDVVRANERYFLNVASGGFGAQIVADTPTALKHFLGGGAYTLSAVLKALNYTPHKGKLIAPDFTLEEESLATLVCNGRQAGGGQILAPNAYIDDGLLDIVVVKTFPLSELAEVIAQFKDPSRKGEYIKHFQAKWVESIPYQERLVNLDGEPYATGAIRYEICEKELSIVMPKQSPLLKDSGL